MGGQPLLISVGPSPLPRAIFFLFLSTRLVRLTKILSSILTHNPFYRRRSAAKLFFVNGSRLYLILSKPLSSRSGHRCSYHKTQDRIRRVCPFVVLVFRRANPKTFRWRLAGPSTPLHQTGEWCTQKVCPIQNPSRSYTVRCAIHLPFFRPTQSQTSRALRRRSDRIDQHTASLFFLVPFSGIFSPLCCQPFSSSQPTEGHLRIAVCMSRGGGGERVFTIFSGAGGNDARFRILRKVLRILAELPLGRLKQRWLNV